MPLKSAGIIAYRTKGHRPEVLLVHPGGPFWRHKDLGAWSIPKGECAPGEEPQAAALREFEEETGGRISGDLHALKPCRQAGGKTVLAFALEGDCDASSIRSNSFRMEWPPKSGREQEFPEVDRAAWFALDEARRRILPSQTPLLDELEQLLAQHSEKP